MGKDKKDDKKKDKKDKGDKKDKKDKKDKADKGDKKEKKEKGDKKDKKGAGDAAAKDAKGGAADSAAGASAPATGDQSALFSKFDTGGKGFLDKSDVAKLVQELNASGGNGGGGYGSAVGPRVGPFASSVMGMHPMMGQTGGYGAGSGIYGRTSLGGTGRFGTPGRPGLPPVSSTGPLGGPTGLGLGFGGVPSNTASTPGRADASQVALAQAYQTRMAALSSVAASLLSKRESLAHTLARVQSRSEEVAAAREAIEAETLTDAEAILHRLRAAESAKQAVLQRDAEVLAGDMGAIDRFYASLTSFQPNSSSSASLSASMGMGGPSGDTSQALVAAAGGGAPGTYDPATALEFMRAYPELCAEADRLTAKPVASMGLDSVKADDFERETANRADLAGRYASLVDLVSAKDRIILQMLKERETVQRERENVKAVLSRSAMDRESWERDKQGEVEHWMRVADKLTGELNSVMDKLSSAQGSAAAAAASSGAGAMPNGYSEKVGAGGDFGYGRGGIAVSGTGRLAYAGPGGPAYGIGIAQTPDLMPVSMPVGPPPPPTAKRGAAAGGVGSSAASGSGGQGAGAGGGSAFAAAGGRASGGAGTADARLVPGLRPAGGDGAPLPLAFAAASAVQPSPLPAQPEGQGGGDLSSYAAAQQQGGTPGRRITPTVAA